MRHNSILVILLMVLSLVTPNAAKADAVADKALAVENLYAGSSAAATTLLSSVLDTAKAESERERQLDLAAVKDVMDFLKEPPLKMDNPQLVGTYRGVFVPYASLHGLGDDTIMVSTAGKSIGNTSGVALKNMKGALWFPISSMTHDEIVIDGVKYWKLQIAFRGPNQKVPTIPASLRQEKGATWDKYGWFFEVNVICPNQADASTPSVPAVTAPTTTTVAPPAPPATPPAGGRVRRQPANCRI